MLYLLRKLTHAIAIRLFTSRMGYEIKLKGPAAQYFDAKALAKKAQSAGLSIGDYLETSNLGGIGKRRDEIITRLQGAGIMQHCTTIVEIGAGTGMYLERFAEICTPERYEVYETNVGWAKYIKQTYPFTVVHDADGVTLKQTADEIADMVTAHGVFVYLPVVTAIGYLLEAVRVCKIGGHIVFDCFTDIVMTYEEVMRFKNINPYSTFPVITPLKIIKDFCDSKRLQIIYTFDVNYHSTQCTYFIIKKS